MKRFFTQCLVQQSRIQGMIQTEKETRVRDDRRRHTSLLQSRGSLESTSAFNMQLGCHYYNAAWICLDTFAVASSGALPTKMSIHTQFSMTDQCYANHASGIMP